MYGVTVGAIAGHAVCTTMAVISGRLLANVLSIKTGKQNLSMIGSGRRETRLLIIPTLSFTFSYHTGRATVYILCLPSHHLVPRRSVLVCASTISFTPLSYYKILLSDDLGV